VATAAVALAFASVPKPTKPNEAANSIDKRSFLIVLPPFALSLNERLFAFNIANCTPRSGVKARVKLLLQE
jgi:hypothetical protein